MTENVIQFPMQEPQTEQQQLPESTEPALTLGDFILIQNIIAVAAKRGAFETKEFTVVGNLTDRLDAFITANSPPQDTTAVEDDGQLELPLED